MLTTEQLEQFTEQPDRVAPKCMVCGVDIPAPRDRDSRHKTCTPECALVLKKYRQRVDADRFCQSCGHPCTPEQRKEFTRWRMHRGDRQSDGGGRAFRKYERELMEALAGIKPMLAAYAQEIALNYGTYDESNGEKVVTDEAMAKILSNVRNTLDKVTNLLDNHS
jgi:hypothetical protein